MLATVVFFAGAAAVLALPARTFLAGALDLVAGFFAGGGLEAVLVAVLVVFALEATALEAGLLEVFEAGLVGLF